jgi:hypothetical protein
MALTMHVPGARLLLFVGVAVLLGAMGLAGQARWRAGAAGEQDITGAMRRSDALERQTRGVIRRMVRKERVVQAVLAGRLTLLEAAALFRALDHGPPAFSWTQFRTHLPGDTDEERHCHEVIESVHASLRQKDVPRSEVVRDRLRTELAGHVSRGSLRLPDVEGLQAFIEDAD